MLMLPHGSACMTTQVTFDNNMIVAFLRCWVVVIAWQAASRHAYL